MKTKKMFENKIFKKSLLKSLIALAVIPISLILIILIVMVNVVLTSTTNDDVEKNLRGNALTILTAINQNPGDYYIGEDGNLWKGSFNVSLSDKLIASIAEASDIDVSIYTPEKCAISTIDKVDKINIEAIKKACIDGGYDFYEEKYNMNGIYSYVYGVTIYQDRVDEVVGMIVVSVDNSSRQQSKNKVSSIMMGCASIVLLGALVFVVLYARAITLSLKDGIETLNEVSSGKLYIEFKDKHLKRGDEVGNMYRSIVALVKELKYMIDNIFNQIKKLMLSSNKLNNTAEKTKDSIKKVNRAMTVMSDTAHSQYETSREVTKSIEILKNMIENTYLEIRELNNTKESILYEGGKVNNVISELNFINNSLNSMIKIINSQVEITHNSAQSINKHATMIAEFAEETNLLAINASIESARAGEFGKGFAIVAKEIKDLAEKSSIVSMNITEEIQELLKDSIKSMNNMEEVNNVVDKLNNSITVTENVVDSINIGIKDVSNSAVSIESMINKMDKVSSEILKISDELQKIAIKNAKCASDTSSVTDYMSELFNEAKELKDVSNELVESMSVFKLE